MYVISKEFDFSAAHRIEGHPKCGRLHGHNYVVTIELSAINLNVDSMILDYGVVKQIVKPIIDAMDHRYLVSQDNLFEHDAYALLAQEKGDAYVLPCAASTAELLAEFLEDTIRNEFLTFFERKELPFDFTITVEESSTTSATYWRDHV